MCKNKTFLKNILFVYLPDIFLDERMQQVALEHPYGYNVERLTELALARVGGYEFVDGDGYDFYPDFSDCKTTTVNENTHVVTIGGVENKIGALRICCYNYLKESVDFFFIPKEKLQEVASPCYGKDSHKKRILAKYNAVKDHYNQFEQYRVKDFETLAKSSG